MTNTNRKNIYVTNVFLKYNYIVRIFQGLICFFIKNTINLNLFWFES